MQVFTLFCQEVGSRMCYLQDTHFKHEDILVKSKEMDHPEIMLASI